MEHAIPPIVKVGDGPVKVGSANGWPIGQGAALFMRLPPLQFRKFSTLFLVMPGHNPRGMLVKHVMSAVLAHDANSTVRGAIPNDLESSLRDPACRTAPEAVAYLHPRQSDRDCTDLLTVHINVF